MFFVEKISTKNKKPINKNEDLLPTDDLGKVNFCFLQSDYIGSSLRSKRAGREINVTHGLPDELRTGYIFLMAVYVDKLRDYGWHRGPSCHLIADSVEELMEFAVMIGLRREWFQPKSSPHFDLTVAGRLIAVRHGAIEIDQRTLVIKLREFRTRAVQLSIETLIPEQ